MKIRATFIGQDGSLGYQCTATYFLDVRGNVIHPLYQEGACKPCPYGSVEAFLKNWESVVVE